MLTLVSPATKDASEVARRVSAHANGLAEGGHSVGSAQAVVAAFALVARSESQAEEIGAPALGRFVQAMAGTAPSRPKDLYRQMRANDTDFFGTAERVAAQSDRYTELGIDHVAFISRFGGMAAQVAARGLRWPAPRAFDIART